MTGGKAPVLGERQSGSLHHLKVYIYMHKCIHKYNETKVFHCSVHPKLSVKSEIKLSYQLMNISYFIL